MIGGGEAGGVGYFKHESACVEDGARVGSGTRIWHFSHVMPLAEIGPDCTLGQNVYVANHVRIGRGVKIQNNVSIYEGVVLEDYVFCGPSMVFTNVRTPRSEFPRKPDYQPTRVRRGATLGANATVLCGITIGAAAFIAAGAVVTHDVPDFALMAGMPARVSGWVCACGPRLAFEGTDARCGECGRRYTRDGDVVRQR